MANAIISRKDARAQGLKRYFTGKPCKKASHIAERLCSNGECLACVRSESAERSRRRYASNPSKVLERSKRWAAANSSRKRAHSEKWRAANPEKWRESNRASKLANQKKYTDRQRADYAENPEKYRIVERRRRAQIKGSSGRHTAADLVEILAAQSGRCAYCRVDLKKTKKHVDHIVALAAGGSNARSNLQYLCQPCNQSKSARDPIAFAQSMGLLL